MSVYDIAIDEEARSHVEEITQELDALAGPIQVLLARAREVSRRFPRPELSDGEYAEFERLTGMDALARVYYAISDACHAPLPDSLVLAQS